MIRRIGIPLLFFFALTSYKVSAQQAMPVTGEYSSDSVLYKETLTGGAIFHNLGYGIQGRRGKNLNSFKNRFYELELVYIKSPRQIRSINPYYPSSKSFVYGKLNEFFTLRGGIGMDRQLNRKPYWGGVELRYHYSGGASLGLAKPVYYYVDNNGTGFYETQRFDPDLYILDIVSRAPFTKGFNDLKFHPGVYVKGGISFEFGAYKSKINRLEVGAVIDAFLTDLQLMAFNEPQNFFLTFYLSYSFGKRYNVY